jgi:exportin-T
LLDSYWVKLRNLLTLSVRKIISAIEIAWNPKSEQSLRVQATDYCNRLRNDRSVWQPCISIFTKTPRHSDVIRIFVLEIINSTIQGGALDIQALSAVKDEILRYLRRVYLVDENPESDTTSVQNKIAQTLTCLFSALYSHGWLAYFDDILSLTSKSRNGARDSASGTIFYLRVLNSIHEEIGDQLVPRSREEQDHANILKDMVRERDVQKIALSWQEILSRWRESNDTIAELCLRAVGKWVSWIDIGLVVNQQMLDLLFEQLARAQKTDLRNGEESIRDAAVDVFTEIIGKKMKPQDKLGMISFLNLENVVSQLIACPPLSDRRFSSQYDTDLAETVARLVNNTVLDVAKILDSEPQESGTWQSAENLLQGFLPHVLRFFADEYDEICSTVIPCLSEVLSFLRKAAKIEGPSPQRAVMLLPILKAIFTKMRYDDTSSWGGDEDETDEAEFQYLRKRLVPLQQTIAAVDEQLYMDAVTGLVGQTFENLGTGGTNLDWRDLDLALCEMFSFGDLAIKSGGLYQKNRPNSPAAEKLVHMMLRMVESGIMFRNPFLTNIADCTFQIFDISTIQLPKSNTWNFVCATAHFLKGILSTSTQFFRIFSSSSIIHQPM